MAILAVGGEADTFGLNAGTYVYNDTAGRFDADASRTSLVMEPTVSEYILGFDGTPVELFVHAHFYQEDVAADDLFALGGDDTAFVIALESDGRWSVYRNISAVMTLIGTTDDPVIVNEAADIDLYFLMDEFGAISIYKDQVEIFDYEGDTRTDSTYINAIILRGITGAGCRTNVSQVILADEDTTSMKLVTLPPTGAGATSEWTGDYEDVDETELNEADAISAAEPNLVHTFAMQDIPSPAYDSYAAVALAVGITANNPSDTLISNIQAAVRVGSTNYFSGDSPTLLQDGETKPSVFVFNADPSDDSLWNKSKINAAQVGVKSVE